MSDLNKIVFCCIFTGWTCLTLYQLKLFSNRYSMMHIRSPIPYQYILCNIFRSNLVWVCLRFCLCKHLRTNNNAVASGIPPPPWILHWRGCRCPPSPSALESNSSGIVLMVWSEWRWLCDGWLWCLWWWCSLWSRCSTIRSARNTFHMCTHT